MHHATSPASAGIMTRLRESTSDLHTRAEKSEFQQRLVRGGITPAHYTSWLAQLLLVHDRLDALLLDLRAKRPDLAPVIREDLFQARRLVEDLAFFSVPLDTIEPTPAALRVIEQLEAAAGSVALLGFNYVLEGSKNGSRYIAKAVRRTLPLTQGQGDHYLDPHGESQPQLWAAYKVAMDAITFTEQEHAAMIDAAKHMFAGVEAIGHDLLAREQLATA